MTVGQTDWFPHSVSIEMLMHIKITVKGGVNPSLISKLAKNTKKAIHRAIKMLFVDALVTLEHIIYS